MSTVLHDAAQKALRDYPEVEFVLFESKAASNDGALDVRVRLREDVYTIVHLSLLVMALERLALRYAATVPVGSTLEVKREDPTDAEDGCGWG